MLEIVGVQINVTVSHFTEHRRSLRPTHAKLLDDTYTEMGDTQSSRVTAAGSVEQRHGRTINEPRDAAVVSILYLRVFRNAVRFDWEKIIDNYMMIQ